jgi:hypothetical protein
VLVQEGVDVDVVVVDLDEAVTVTLVQANQSTILFTSQLTSTDTLQRASEASRRIMGREHR